MSVSKLEENSVYTIVDWTPIKTQFGDSYILQDDEFNKYFATKKVTNWIKRNRPKKAFTIKTSEMKTFNKDDKEIQYMEVLFSLQ